MATRERAAQMHRVAQLENERDEAIREAANIAGRASAERETASSKLRELEELRVQRDGLNRELTELKQVLAGHTAENAAEKRQLQARLRELEVHNEARINDFKSELERTREELERLQVSSWAQSTQFCLHSGHIQVESKTEVQRSENRQCRFPAILQIALFSL